VKSPDHIRDVTTGQLREVDASIRCTIGSTPILIIIECRHRNRPADIQWIEQLATKRDSIRADKVIAVSSAGFYGPTIRAAQHHRIELRTFSQISQSDLNNWFLPPGGIVNVFRVFDDLQCIVGFTPFDDSGNGKEWEVPGMAPVFHTGSKSVPSPFTAEMCIRMLEQTEGEKFCQVPLDGTKTPLTFTMDCSSTDFHADTSQGRKKVYWISLSVSVSYQTTKLAMADGEHYKYDGTQSGSTMVSARRVPLITT
jgi:hypothetical protein